MFYLLCTRKKPVAKNEIFWIDANVFDKIADAMQCGRTLQESIFLAIITIKVLNLLQIKMHFYQVVYKRNKNQYQNCVARSTIDLNVVENNFPEYNQVLYILMFIRACSSIWQQGYYHILYYHFIWFIGLLLTRYSYAAQLQYCKVQFTLQLMTSLNLCMAY